MVFQIFFTILLGCLFFLTVPVIGAMTVRARWRKFRNMLIEGASYPYPDYQVLHGHDSGFLGTYQFSGYLKAMEGEEWIWLSDGRFSLRVRMADVTVYVIDSPGESVRVEDYFGGVTPRRIGWSHFGALPEGVRIHLFGALYAADGRIYFQNTPEHPLLVIQHEGAFRDLLSLGVARGRDKNEYLNRLTPFAVFIGSMSLISWGYYLLHSSYGRLAPFLSLAMSLYPVFIFFPPGLFLFYLYVHCWRRGRVQRIYRDLFQLPLSVPPGTRLPSGRVYDCKAVANLQEAREIAPRAKLLMNGLEDVEVFEVFGIIQEDGLLGGDDSRGLDSFITPGDPRTLAKSSALSALKWELLAVLAFGSGFLLNLMLVWLLMIYYIF